ncbi:hypothetical protein TNCV_614251 [Trichonephila clavipes]|nr:hypothetical protein TNCV_614251 [Trichonephila clavipes]
MSGLQRIRKIKVKITNLCEIAQNVPWNRKLLHMHYLKKRIVIHIRRWLNLIDLGRQDDDEASPGDRPLEN